MCTVQIDAVIGMVRQHLPEAAKEVTVKVSAVITDCIKYMKIRRVIASLREICIQNHFYTLQEIEHRSTTIRLSLLATTEPGIEPEVCPDRGAQMRTIYCNVTDQLRELRGQLHAATSSTVAPDVVQQSMSPLFRQKIKDIQRGFNITSNIWYRIFREKTPRMLRTMGFAREQLYLAEDYMYFLLSYRTVSRQVRYLVDMEQLHYMFESIHAIQATLGTIWSDLADAVERDNEIATQAPGG
jgi:hypothetical protein